MSAADGARPTRPAATSPHQDQTTAAAQPRRWALAGSFALPLQLRQHLQRMGFGAHLCNCGHGGVLTDNVQALRAHFRSRAHLSVFPEEAPRGTQLHAEFRADEIRRAERAAQWGEDEARVVDLAAQRGGVRLMDLWAEFGGRAQTLIKRLLKARRLVRARNPENRRQIVFHVPRPRESDAPLPVPAVEAGPGDAGR